MAVNVGVNVIEVDGRASPTIQAAPTSVAAFLGVTERGVPNRPLRITSPQQFGDRFGGYRADAFLAYAIDGFFLNGGREAYVNRVVGAGSTPAALTLNNRLGAPTPALRISAGYRNEADPGLWGERLRVDVRDDPRGQSALQAAAPGPATSAVLLNVSGFQVGSVVRFVDGATTVHRKLIDVVPLTRTISWTAPIAAGLTAAATATTAEFRLILRYQPTAASDFAVVEDWRRLSMETDSADYAAGRINHAFTGSRYVTVADLSAATGSGEENPAVISNQPLTGSVENAPAATDYLGSAALKTGYRAFDTLQIQLLAVPDAHRLVPAARDQVVRGALDYCASDARGDAMFVGSAPDRGAPAGVTPRALSDYTQLESAYPATVKGYSATFQAAKVFGALYTPFIRVADPIGPGPAPALFIPADGHVMGVYARTEQERGIFKAPAGNAAQVRGALAVSSAFTDVEHTDLVRVGFVNGIRFTAGTGITVAASRTLSTDTRWWFVGVRLLFNFVKASLRDGLRFVRQEPHSEQLRRAVRFNVVTPFLLGLWRQGAFGSGAPEEVFSVKCDAENNPPTEVNLGNFKVEVYFYPSRPAETILVVVGQQPSGASASEA
jgi:phage tail sheath protein FI